MQCLAALSVCTTAHYVAFSICKMPVPSSTVSHELSKISCASAWLD